MSLPPGHLRWRGQEDWKAVALQAMDQADLQRSGALWIEAQGQRAYLKFGPLKGKHRLRHGIRARLTSGELPRLQEFENLVWLRAHGFGAPRPLLAGAIWKHGLPNFQFLVTEKLAQARDLRSLAGVPGDLAPALQAIGRLGAEIGRLHSLGFTHRDLYPRNSLGQAETGAGEWHLLDTWRGGPRRGLRGSAYDLGAFFLFAPELFGAAACEQFLHAYGEARPGHLDSAFRSRVMRARTRLAAELRQKQRSRHGFPELHWRLPD